MIHHECHEHDLGHLKADIGRCTHEIWCDMCDRNNTEDISVWSSIRSKLGIRLPAREHFSVSVSPFLPKGAEYHGISTSK